MFNRELTFLFLFGSSLVSSTQNTNVARNKMAYESSRSGTAGLAVNDDVSSCSQTVSESLWWYVDLGNVYSVNYLRIYRIGLNLMDVVVRVSDSSSTVLSTDSICGTISSETPESDDYFFLECKPSLSGQYVSLRRSSSIAIVLTLCDVRVFVPIIECPEDIIAGTTSSNPVIAVSWDSPVVADDSPLSCDPSSGSMFTLSLSNPVTCTTLSGSCQFNVQVIEDSIDPSITCPQEINWGTIGNQSTTTVEWNLLVTDNTNTGLTSSCSPPSGSSFPVGASTVTCNGSDSVGNSGEPCTFTVTVIDFGLPIITCPAKVQKTTNLKQVNVTWDDPLVTDNIDADLSATCTPSSGSSFSAGSTDVACTATDSAGNEGSCQFLVEIIKDDISPMIACPKDNITQRNGNQATVTWDDLLVTDNFDMALSATCTPSSGSSFSTGSTNVTCSATDSAGNEGSCIFIVTVEDVQRLTVTCPSDIEETLPEVTWNDPLVTDNMDTDLSANCTPSSGSSFPVGSTYVTCTAIDNTGNEGSCIFEVIVNDAGPSDGSTSGDGSPSDGNLSIIIVIVVILVVLLLIIAIVLVIKMRSKRQYIKNRPAEQISLSTTNDARPVSEPLAPVNNHIKSKGDDSLEDSNKYVDFSKSPIALKDLLHYVNEKKQNGELEKEWAQFPEGVQSTERNSVAFESAHATKNRYRNVIPYDEHRVVLEQINEDPSTDYINASYIKGFGGENTYIAAQGPNKSTVNDFWRMIWQENVSIIIMTTNLVEDGKNKCTQYWPEGATKYGNVAVLAMEVTTKTAFTVRKLRVTKDNEIRNLIHYHFLAWPDKNIPQSSSTVVSLLNTVQKETPQNAGPLLVHCSAGAGRTGALIAIDAMIKMAQETNEINVFEFVKEMRTRRPNMVQTPLQYEFVYTTLLEYVLLGHTSCPSSAFKKYFQELKKINPETKKSHLSQEFKALQSLTGAIGDATTKGGVLPENADKNRYPDIIPYDRNRPYLMTPGESGSNYINASFFDSFYKKDMFIGTQAPLANTVEDFWRMMFDYNSKTAVILNDFVNRDKTVAEFLPGKGLQFNFRHLTVSSLTSEELSKQVKVQTVNITKNDENKSLDVKVFEYLGWPVIHYTPTSTSDFLQLVTLVNKWQSEIGDPIIVSMCLNGLDRTGVFCATMSALCMLNEEQMVDIAQTVKLLRTNRPGMVGNLQQYEFIYKTIHEHLLAFEVYDNMPKEETLYANV